ncbi:MAG: PAS domain-containing protein [Pirellulales bacterium]
MRTRSKTSRKSSRPSPYDRERLLEQSFNLVCVGGLDGRLKRVNPAALAAFGYTQHEMTSIPMDELVHPDDRARMAESFAQLASGKGVHGVEVRIRGKDGTDKWVLWEAVSCPAEGVFLATGHDITQRKAAEEELRQSQERFQLLAGATDEAVWDWDLRTNHIWRNDAYHRAYGIPNDAEVGAIEWWRQRIHPDDVERVLQSMPPPLVEGRQQWLLEYRLRRRDGSYADVYDRGFTIFDCDGNPVRMVGSVLDITRLKRAERDLRDSEERFRLAARATRDVIWDWDMREGRVWRSEGFEATFGYRADEVSSDLNWWIECTHPEDRDRVCAQIAELHSQRSEQHAIEYRFLRADGTYANVLERAFVMYDESDRPVRMVGSLMDISARRRAEEMFSMQQAELAHMARVTTMGEIASGLAHELNQPLAAIANYAESCAQALASNAPDAIETTRAWVEKIAANTHRAGEIIRRLRGFTRKSERRPVAVDVNDLLREVIELLEPETRRRNVRLRCDSTDVPSVVVDPVQIQQVLVNLLHNAYDALAEMPPERRLVTIGIEPADNAVRISVSDQGRGIEPGNRDKVFDAFFSTKPKGMGIGLAISRSIIEDHGGRLCLAANPKYGVTFHFKLPVVGGQNGHIPSRNGH